MTPGKYEEEEYTSLCRGVERLARLYKNKGETGSVKRKGIGRRLFLAVRRLGVHETLRRVRDYLFGVERLLPVTDMGNDASDGRRNYFSNERIAVYTAEFGGYAPILEPVMKPDNIDYYVVTDDVLPLGSCWKALDPSAFIPKEYLGDPVRSNRWCKMHPHELFPEYCCSIYVDANILIVSDLTELLNRMEEFPVAMFRHKNRVCVYEEVDACIIKHKVSWRNLRKQRALLKEHGVPEKYGLMEAGVIVRRHGDSRCIELMTQWWQSFLEGCGRDQISLIDALWKMKIRPSRLGVLGPNLYLCDLYIVMPHKKR